MGRAQTEGDEFDAALGGSEDFRFVDRVSQAGNLADVGGGIGDVFIAGAAQGGDRGRSEAKVVVTFPVALVMAGVMAILGVVGGFVMIESGLGQDVLGEVVVIGIVVFVFPVGAVLERVKKRGVFLIGEVVGGDVVRFQGNGVAQGIFPIGERLPGDGEHEVDVDGVDSGLAEGMDGFGGLFGGVLATECLENVGGERLDTERNAGDAEGFEQSGFFQIKGGGVGFEGDFLNFGEIEMFTKGMKQVSQVFGGEHGRCAAAEVERGGLGNKGLETPSPYCLMADRFDKCADGRVARGVLVKRAIGTDPMAKGDVDVKEHETLNFKL